MSGKPCPLCKRGEKSARRFGWYWHWNRALKALVRCSDDEARLLCEVCRGTGILDEVITGEIKQCWNCNGEGREIAAH